MQHTGNARHQMSGSEHKPSWSSALTVGKSMDAPSLKAWTVISKPLLAHFHTLDKSLLNEDL